MNRRVIAFVALVPGIAAAMLILFEPLSGNGQDDAGSTRLSDAIEGDPVSAARLSGALHVHWTQWNPSAGRWDSVLTPIDAASAQSLAGYDPVPVPHGVVSPDGKLMVFSERNLGVPAESEVEVSVVDLEDWQIVRTIETAPGVGAGIWSADSEHMYVWREHCGQPADRGYCSEQWQRGLWEIDAAAGTAREVVAYDFSVIGQQVSASRERAYALAIRTDVCCGIDPEGDAFVAVIDIAAGEVIAELPMPGMFIGQPGHWLGDTKKLASYHPAISLSPDGSHLYVVDPVEDSVQIIDTMSLAVAGAIDFREKDSKLSRFEDWLASQLVGAAEAKGNPSYSRMAAITPDGRYLLISGTRAYEEPAKGRDFEWTDRPSGLVVINLATREAVLREANVGWFRVSPDGRWVLATGQYHDEALIDEDGFGGLVAFGLKVVDLQSLDVVAHGWEGGEVNIAAISPDSKYGYVITDGPGIEAFRRATPPAACGPNCRLLQVIDFNGNGVIATRSLGENESILPLTAWP